MHRTLKNTFIATIFSAATYLLWRLFYSLYFGDVRPMIAVVGIFFLLIIYSNFLSRIAVALSKTNYKK